MRKLLTLALSLQFASAFAATYTPESVNATYSPSQSYSVSTGTIAPLFEDTKVETPSAKIAEMVTKVSMGVLHPFAVGTFDREDTYQIDYTVRVTGANIPRSVSATFDCSNAHGKSIFVEIQDPNPPGGDQFGYISNIQAPFDAPPDLNFLKTATYSGGDSVGSSFGFYNTPANRNYTFSNQVVKSGLVQQDSQGYFVIFSFTFSYSHSDVLTNTMFISHFEQISEHATKIEMVSVGGQSV